MEYTQLDEYPLPSGTLTEWIPSVDDPVSTWKDDARRLSFAHENHCHRKLDSATDQPESGAGSWIGTAFEIHQRFDERAVRDAIVAYFGRHEAFRSLVDFDTVDQTWRRRIASAESIRIDHRAVEGVTDGAHIVEHLRTLFGRTISPLTWPHCIVTTVQPAADSERPDSFVFVFAADHSVMDVYSQIFAISEITRLYISALTGENPALPAVGSYVDFSNSERLLGESITEDHHAVTTWRNFLADNGGDLPPFPLPLSNDTRAVRTAREKLYPQSSLSSWLLTPLQSENFNSACRAAGYNMQTGILAALALANRELTGQQLFRTVMPQHTRDEDRWAASVGWYVGISPLEVDLTDDDTFLGALPHASAGLGAHRSVARYPYPRIAELLGTTSIPRFVLSYIDLRLMPNAEEWQTWKGRALRSTCSAEDEVYFWVNRTPRGLNISSRFPSADTGQANVRRFIAEFHRILLEISSETGAHADIDRPSVFAE